MKLLIVDDEIQIIQGILKGVRWEQLNPVEVLTAKSYDEALPLFREKQIDILLSDIEMTGQSGLDLIEWVNVNSPVTACIILSCHDEFDFARQAVRLKCRDYVLKPIPYEALTEILARAVEAVRRENNQMLYENYGKAYLRQITARTGTDSRANTVERAVEYINCNLAAEFTVEELARTVYMHPDHLTRLFRRQFGQTVSDYIMQQRMILAGELLKNGQLSITMVSAAVGYSNYSYFIRLFKRFYGMTPREYRLKYR